MKPAKCISVFFWILAAGLSTTPAGELKAQGIDDGRPWLASRALPPPNASPILRAAAASARNQPQSERLLLRIVRSQPASEEARQAHDLLSRIYLRTGQYRRLLENLDQWSRSFPNDPQVPKDLEQFRGLPDQINGPRRVSNLTHGPEKDFNAPILINGKRAAYLLDTGAWLSVMTESEAKRLGLPVRASAGLLMESSGKGVNIKTAIAKDLKVGSTVFHDVSFAILPDVEPWRSMPVGRAGIIGVPILLHLGCIRWRQDRSWTLGCAPARNDSAPPNLVFYKNRILLSSLADKDQVFMTLDTGAETTDLNTNFAQQFAGQIQRQGVKDQTSVIGAGGTSVIESVTLPAVDFSIGGGMVSLRPAHVTMQNNPAMGGDCCIGNAGLDLLLQTGALTIDFSSMSLRLRVTPEQVRSRK